MLFWILVLGGIAWAIVHFAGWATFWWIAGTIVIAVIVIGLTVVSWLGGKKAVRNRRYSRVRADTNYNFDELDRREKYDRDQRARAERAQGRDNERSWIEQNDR